MRRLIASLVSLVIVPYGASAGDNVVAPALSAEAAIAEVFSRPMEDIQTGEVSSIDAYEDQIIYLDFWASWCAPCIYSLPHLNDLHRAFADQNFHVISINVDAHKEDAERFIEKLDLDYPVFFADDGELLRNLKIKGLPTGILIGANRKPVLIHQGFAPGHESFLQARIDREIKLRDWQGD